MNTIIQLVDRHIGDRRCQTVNARDLHAFLAVGKVFAAWIQERIAAYGFLQGSDYEVFSETGNNPAGGRPAREYALTLDMAKELAMVERTEKGKQARQYFLECERRANATPAHPLIPQSLPEALRLAADLADQKAKAEAALALAAPKAAALDRIAVETDGAVCLRVAAKLAQVPEKAFNNFLIREGWLFRHHHSQTLMGYADKERAGLIELKRTRVTRDDGSEKVCEQVLLTPRGIAKAAELIERKEPHLRKVALPIASRQPASELAVTT